VKYGNLRWTDVNMNRTLRVLSVAGFVSLCGAALCCAQNCTEGMNTTRLTCVFGSCRSAVYVETPANRKPISNYSCDSVSCCGQLFTTCIEEGPCEIGELRDPAILRRVNDAAAKYSLLVADCTGRYVRYRLPRTEQGMPDYWLSDRMLR
jgi:hypothetical protein